MKIPRFWSSATATTRGRNGGEVSAVKWHWSDRSESDAQEGARRAAESLAARIATNRVVAGLHFPVDNLAGRLLGHTLGEYVMARLLGPGNNWQPRRFDGALVPNGTPFDPLRQPLTGGAAAPYFLGFGAAQLFSVPSTILDWMWDRAYTECAFLR